MTMTMECLVCKGNVCVDYWDAQLERDCVSVCTVCENGRVRISSMDFGSFERAGMASLVEGAPVSASPLPAPTEKRIGTRFLLGLRRFFGGGSLG